MRLGFGLVIKAGFGGRHWRICGVEKRMAADSMVPAGSLYTVRSAVGQPSANAFSSYLDEGSGLKRGQQLCRVLTDGAERRKRPPYDALLFK